MIRKKIISIILGILSLSYLAFAADNEDISQNDKIKSVFIYNFTKYIQWPENDTSQVFTIGVLGKSNIILPLQKIAQKKLVQDRKIQIKQFQDLENIEICHILFISSSIDKDIVSDVLQMIKGKNILTVGEVEGFSDEGGIINLILVEGKIKFEMNLKALHRAGLTAGSQLLKLAKIIGETKK